MKSNKRQLRWIVGLIVLLAFTLLAAGAAFGSARDTYKQARRQLNKDNYERAADLFEEVYKEAPDSEEAPDALYWHAFSLYRLGGGRDLDKALDLLERLADDYPDAAFISDAEALVVRIRSAQARDHGDPEALRDLLTEAEGFEFEEAEFGEALGTLIAAITELTFEATRHGLREAQEGLEKLNDEEFIMTEDLEEMFEELDNLSAEFEFDWNGDSDLSRREVAEARRLIRKMGDRRVHVIPRSQLPQLSQPSQPGAITIPSTSDDVRIVYRPEDAELPGAYLIGGGDRVYVYEPELDNDEDDIRLSALNALLQMDSDRAMPILEKILDKRGAKDADLRERAVFIVGQSDEPEAVDLLMEVARDDPDDEVREAAVFWLSQVGGSESLDALHEIYRETRNKELKDKAIFAIGQHGSRRSLEILREIAADSREPEEARESAIFWLGQQDGDAFEFLRSLYKDIESRTIREKLIFSIAQNDSRESEDWLLERVRDRREDTELRCNALFWAAQVGTVTTRDIDGLWDELDSPKMKEQMIFVLSQQDDADAVDMLLKIARDERDPEIRKQAVFWLGQSDDDRAMDVLEEIINGK